MQATTALQLSGEPAAASPCRDDRARDLELVRRLQAGDELAFRELVEKCQSRIYSVIFGILRDRQQTEDIAQEVFAKVYFSIQRFQGRSSLLTWMHRIAVNETYAYLRAQRARPAVQSESSWSAAGLADVADTRSTPEEAAARRDYANKLLMWLPQRDRVLLLRREVEGLSLAQLAAATGMNENTLKTRLFRARRRLAEVAARLSKTPGRLARG